MGYEIAGGLGVKMAHPDREVVVMVGDGSYMMMNSELATSVMLGRKLVVVLLDNRGYGCINRLQLATGGASFNNLLDTARHVVPSADRLRRPRRVDGRAPPRRSAGSPSSRRRWPRARASDRSYVVVIDTDPLRDHRGRRRTGGTSPCPRSPRRREVRAARRTTRAQRELQRLAD